MKDFLELLVMEYGFPKFIASNIMMFFYIVTFIIVAIKFIVGVLNKFKSYTIKKLVDKDLHPYFIHREIYNYTKLYIPQYFQNITPSEGEEPGKIHAAAAKSKLMNEFIKKGLLTESPVKYFILLSDTGMGKTAFLINLFIKYKRSSIKIGKPKYDIKLYPLGSTDSLDKIREIKNKGNTILLLDAFDEDIKAVADYKNRMIEILESVRDFRKVIFTCRTQFFPNKDEEPLDTDDMTFGENIKHSIQKLYLSAFDDLDIFKYLLKKYGINLFSLYKAYRLVKKSPSLMFRPMLLSHIDDLINEKIYYNFTFEMYYVLIENWIKRESQKPAVRDRAAKYSTDLLKFSMQLSKNLYTERERRDGYFISYSELQEMTSKQMFNTEILTFDDKTGRSLLNRNSIGQFKFAHKSILEYFLALEIFEHPEFLLKFDFHGMDATLNFHFEMLASFLRSLEGKYLMKGDNNYKNVNSILPSHIRRMESLIILSIENVELKRLAGLSNLKSIIITDPSFLIIYLIYLFICIQKRISKMSTNQVFISTFQTYTHGYEAAMRRISDLLPKMDYNYLNNIIDNCTIEDSIKQIFKKIIHPDIIKDPIRKDEIDELKNLKLRIVPRISENVLINNSLSQIQKIEKLSKFIPDVDLYY